MPSDAEKLRQRAQSLRRAWDILQTIRKVVEASSGEPIPEASRKSIDEEGMIVAKHLAKELVELHRRVNKCRHAAIAAWDFHMERSRDVNTMRWVGEARQTDVKTEKELHDIFWLPVTLKEEREALKPAPTAVPRSKGIAGPIP